MSHIKNPVIRSLVQSPFLDLIGAALVLGVCISRSFHETIFFESKIQYGIPISELLQYMKQGAFPLGILSTIGAIFSMLATRFTGKQKNAGNIIGAITTISSGALDYMFGNASAIITYPLTFFVFTFAIKRWAGGEKIKKIDVFYFLILFGSFVLGMGLVYLGAYLFGGRTEGYFLLAVALSFGISLGANICNALKYEETWLSWIAYNLIQLLKNSITGNLANVAKYVFYLFNAVITQIDWKVNGDVSKQIA